MNGPGAFSARTMIALILVSVFALAAVVVLSAYAPELRRSGGSGINALSKSAVGFAGAVDLLQARGVKTTSSRSQEVLTDGVLVLTPRPGQSPKDIARDSNTAVLIVLPKWETMPNARRRGWVHKLNPLPTRELSELLEEVAPGTVVERRNGRERPRLVAREVRTPPKSVHPGVEPEPGRLLFTPGMPWRPGPVDALQTVVGPSWTAVLAVENGDSSAVLVKHGQSNVYLLSDPDLLNTQGLKDFETTLVGMAIMDALRGPDGPVVFDLTLHGLGRSRSLLRLALEPPFLGATLCLLVAGGLMGLHAAARFGPAQRPERAFALGKTALADNTAALIRLTGREHRLAPGYAALVRASVARAVGAPRDLSLEQLDAFLDRLSRRRGAANDYTALARDAAGAEDREGLLRTARALHGWKQEITGEHR